jgi:hypothetical protein
MMKKLTKNSCLLLLGWLFMAAVICPSCSPSKSQNWTPSFVSDGTSPFECKLFDKAFVHLFSPEENRNVYVSSVYTDADSLVSGEKNPFYNRNNFLWAFIDIHVMRDSIRQQAMSQIISDGHSSVLMSENFGGRIATNHQSFDFQAYCSQVNSDGKAKVSKIRDELSGKDYSFPSAFCACHFKSCDFRMDFPSSYSNGRMQQQVLATIDGEPIAIQYVDHVTGRSVLICSTPLLFTNYGLTYGNNAELIFNILKRVDWKFPIVRLYSSKVPNIGSYDSGVAPQKQSKQSKSDHDNLNADSPLVQNLFFWLGTALFVLFLLFVARRRQRIIPIMEAPGNRTLDFIRQISRIYEWEENYSGLLQKKSVFFYDTIKNRLHINLDDADRVEENAAFVSAASGYEVKKMRSLLIILNRVLRGKRELDKEEAFALIDQIDDVLNGIVGLWKKQG